MTDNIQTSRQIALRRGEPAVLCTFVAIPVLWTALVVPMIYCSICVRSLFFALGTAALVGMLAGIVREVVIEREDY